MVSAIETVSIPTGAAAERYRTAERTLWSSHGLEPVERWIELSNPRMRMRVMEIGSGNPVLLVPGTGGTGPYWAPLVRELQGRRCVMIDRPGWGLSSPIDYTADAYRSLVVRILSGVLDELELDRVDIVGASIGAIWALRLAQAAPPRVGRVVLIGGSPNREVEIPAFIRLLRSPIGALLVRIPMKAGMLRKQLVALGHGAALDRGAMEDFIAWRLAFQRNTDSMRHERDMVKAITGPKGFKAGVTFEDGELREMDRPTLMVFGTADPTGTADIWRRFIAGLPHGELRLIDDAGHIPWWDAPSEVAGHVDQFLGRPA